MSADPSTVRKTQLPNQRSGSSTDDPNVKVQINYGRNAAFSSRLNAVPPSIALSQNHPTPTEIPLGYAFVAEHGRHDVNSEWITRLPTTPRRLPWIATPRRFMRRRTHPASLTQNRVSRVVEAGRYVVLVVEVAPCAAHDVEQCPTTT